ncbi:MAG: hypothetical protein ABW277_25875 [Longimicrobiaceae bacterium]
MSPLRDGWEMADVEAVIGRGVPDELLHVPIAVSMGPPDCAWAADVCLRLASHPHPNVRGNAVLGFGHLARTCGDLDEARVRPVVEAALRDPDPYVSGQADAAVGDLVHFMGWRIDLPDPGEAD